MSKTVEISINEKAKIYAFLKTVFAREPSSDFLAYLRTPVVFESLQATGICLKIEDFSESQLPHLIEDYTQLFIGPSKHIALNESVYTEKTARFWGESTVKIKKLMEFIGLELEKHWNQMPDHISVEFELMEKLLKAKIEALEEKDLPTAEQCDAVIDRLFNEHIIRWVPQVCDQAIEKAQTKLYRALGMWVKTFIQGA